MTLSLLLLGTLASVARCAWIRRATWGSPWDAANTLGVVLFGLALTLMSPGASRRLGPILHQWTGDWQFEDLIGHVCALVGCACLVYNSLVRIARDDEDLDRLANHLVVPVAYAVPLMFAAFVLTDAKTGQHLDMLKIPTDNWLKTYWCTTSLASLWLALVLMWALWIARSDTRCRSVVIHYLAGAVIGAMASLTCALNAFTSLPLGNVSWYLGCLATFIFATVSAAAWRKRLALSAAGGQSSVGA